MRPEPSLKYNEYQLDSGRIVRLRSLNQDQIYRGLLEGKVTPSLNNNFVSGLLDEAASPRTKVHLIPPFPREFVRLDPHEAFKEAFRRRHEEDGESLPAMGCIGYFESKSIGGNSDYSAITLVWFQDRFAMPILDPALAVVRALDWDNVADDDDR